MSNKATVMSFITRHVKKHDNILLIIDGGQRGWRCYTWLYDGVNPSFLLEEGEIVKSISWSYSNIVGNHKIRHDYKF